MSSIGRKKLTKKKVFINEDRQRILNVLENKHSSITQLEKQLKINRGTLKHHLKIMYRCGIITFKKMGDMPGRPVIYSPLTISKNNNQLKLFKKLNKRSQNFFDLIEEFPNSDEVLNLILTRNKFIDLTVTLNSEGERFLKENT